jgi:hypothetical protein
MSKELGIEVLAVGIPALPWKGIAAKRRAKIAVPFSSLFVNSCAFSWPLFASACEPRASVNFFTSMTC